MALPPPGLLGRRSMTRFDWSVFALLILAQLGVAREARAAESYDNCAGFITSLPAVIATPGTWCLKQDLSTAITTGIAITISTDNVTVDCNDFKLGGLAAGSATHALGIHAANRYHVTVRNCNIRGFNSGLTLNAGGGIGGKYLVEDCRFDGNTYKGLDVDGDGSMVRRNRVFDTGGSTINTLAFAITTSGSVDILDNTISGVAATSGGGGYARGISTDLNTSGRIIGNGISGLLGDGSGTAYAIENNSSDRISIRNNNLVGDGGSGSVGMICTSSSGRAKDNVVSGFFLAIGGCGDAGGNTVIL